MKKTTKKTLKSFVVGVIITTMFMSTAVGAQIKNTIDVMFNTINIKINGEDQDIDNFLYEGTTYVPLRDISDLFDKEVSWDSDTNTASIEDKEISNFREIYEISEKWAEALKNRDGKIRYELMAPKSKSDYYNSLIEINGDIEYPWVIGWSSPYVESYDIKTSGTSAVITYITKYQSELEEEYIYQEELFFTNIDGKTYVSKYYKLDITTTDEDLIIDIGNSTQFTKKEIAEAINVVKDNFKFPASTLTKVWYNEEESDKFSKLYLESGKGSVNGVKPENVIVLLSNFDVDDSSDNPVLNPDSTYENYQWIVIRPRFYVNPTHITL